ncbi:hypothetical protein LEMLEM_LOCUS22189 [Lemmus lemmus]
MEGPASWVPSVPVHLSSMDATVSVMYEKSTVGLSSMAPGCPRSAPCAGAGSASSTVFLRLFYLAVVSNCTSLVLSSPVDA